MALHHARALTRVGGFPPAGDSRPLGRLFSFWAAALPLAASLAGAAAPAPGALDAAVARIGELDGVRTVAVWAGERRLAARTFRGAGPGAHDVKSASKSVLSALVGIALERGLLPGLDAPLAELLPDAAARLDDAGKRAITLRHLLTMTAGLGSTSGAHYGRWVAARDWVRAALARPLEHPPGTTFTYSTGNSHLIAAALTRAVGGDLLAWAREVLFTPLGVAVEHWDRDPAGIRFGGNSFALAPADFARLGQLYLAGGRWRERQLVPADWIELSTRRASPGWPERYGAYGMLWWLPEFEGENAYMAVGYGGQYLIVAPRSGAVVVVTASHRGKGTAWDVELLRRVEREVLPAARASLQPPGG